MGLAPSAEHLELLTHDKEGTLIRNLGEFPRVLKTAAALREPHRVSRYLEDLAGDVGVTSTVYGEGEWRRRRLVPALADVGGSDRRTAVRPALQRQ